MKIADARIRNLMGLILRRHQVRNCFVLNNIFEIINLDNVNVPDFKRSFQKFSFRSFTNRSNIFKNVFYAFVLFSERWDLDRSVRSFESPMNCEDPKYRRTEMQ